MTVTAMPKAGAEAAPGAEEPAKSKKKLIMILLVLVLAIGGSAYWFVLKPAPGPVKPVAGTVVPLEPIQINLAGEHYLRIGVALQLTAGTKEADGSKALDATIDEFSGKSIGEVTDPAKRRELKKALEKELDHLYEGEVMGVYFTEFVTQ
jgi:flagellar FliL protein